MTRLQKDEGSTVGATVHAFHAAGRPGVPQRADILEYIATMAGELSTLAARADAATLAGLFNLAQLEAELKRACGEEKFNP